ncbi:hypothetical protein [Bacillus safensis]|uniref:hypothetical protein n=1 Tax=Bacillus safensis TaxID=561879 RepID=UPI002280D9C7|nr:hypothetical protein [Bacillus safensis]MCY7676068.1 hypothetical protein [Bacillus safensis]MCY7699222.1 hypothetical protein [Bacillus safensis]MEC3627887.1 hypothetical protein [Bacillus safensis]
METYELVSDYRHDNKLKESFNKLAIHTLSLTLPSISCQPLYVSHHSALLIVCKREGLK